MAKLSYLERMTISTHFPRASYLTGAASVFDLRGRGRKAHREARSAGEADSIAIAQDWAAVSRDLNAAVLRVSAKCER